MRNTIIKMTLVKLIKTCLKNYIEVYGNADVAAHSLYEMTFFGYSSKTVDKRVKEEKRILDKGVREIENGTSQLISFEEAMGKINFVDKRTPGEKEKEYREYKRIAAMNEKIYKIIDVVEEEEIDLPKEAQQSIDEELSGIVTLTGHEINNPRSFTLIINLDTGKVGGGWSYSEDTYSSSGYIDETFNKETLEISAFWAGTYTYEENTVEFGPFPLEGKLDIIEMVASGTVTSMDGSVSDWYAE